MTFITSFKDEDGKIEDRVYFIAKKYILSWLFTDILVIFPL